jgi:hypothetical protein
MRRLLGTTLTPLVNLLAIDHDRRRRLDADANVIASHGHDRDADIAVNHNLFPWPTC